MEKRLKEEHKDGLILNEKNKSMFSISDMFSNMWGSMKWVFGM